MVKFYTLVFLMENAQILLGYKKRGFGEKLWNGFGGKLENCESIEQCVQRELYEECSLIVKEEDLIYLGYVCYMQDLEERIVFIYAVEKYSGTPQESEEMIPKWFNFEDIPYDKMFQDSKEWMQLVLSKCFMKCYFRYNSEGIIKQDVQVLSKAPIWKM